MKILREQPEVSRCQDVYGGRVRVTAERLRDTGKVEAVSRFRDAAPVDLRPAAEAGERGPLVTRHATGGKSLPGDESDFRGEIEDCPLSVVRSRIRDQVVR